MRAALALLLLLPAVALASSGQYVGFSAPLLVWGSKGQGARVSYEVRGRLCSFLGDLTKIVGLGLGMPSKSLI